MYTGVFTTKSNFHKQPYINIRLIILSGGPAENNVSFFLSVFLLDLQEFKVKITLVAYWESFYQAQIWTIISLFEHYHPESI